MKKATSLMIVLSFSAVMLFGEAIKATAEAALCCDDLSGCGGTVCCDGNGRGTANGCIIQCDSGVGIICPKSGGGGGEELLQ